MMTGHRVRIIELVYIGLINDVRRLIEAGCDVDEKDYCGNCAVTLCVENNDAEILQILIEDGNANVDVKDPLGRSALSRAQQLKHNECAVLISKTLLSKQQEIKHTLQENPTVSNDSTSNSSSFFNKHDEELKQSPTTLTEQIIATDLSPRIIPKPNS